jgi:hypothetical protein
VAFRLPFAFLIFNFAFLHSGATARDSHPLPYSPRSFMHGAPGRFFLKRTKELYQFPSMLCGADVITPVREKSKGSGQD